MLGMIAGDICGSTGRRHGESGPNFEFIAPGATFTANSVGTFAIADALLHGCGDAAIVQMLQSWHQRYAIAPHGMSGSWSGCAYRATPCGWMATTLEGAERLADLMTRVTHRQPDARRGAQAIAVAIWLFRQGESAKAVRRCVTRRYHYDLAKSLRVLIGDNETSIEPGDPVPFALMCALQAESFEGALRRTDCVKEERATIAGMAGGVAEARFGLPEYIKMAVWELLTHEMRTVSLEFSAIQQRVELEEAEDSQANPPVHTSRFAFLSKLWSPL